MKKIILIIFMAMISSFSYYGAVNENGEKVTSFENMVQEQEDIKQEESSNQIEMQEQNEKKEEQKEKILEQETTQNSDKSTEVVNTTDKTKTTSNIQKDTQKQENTTKSKTQNTKNTIEKQQNKENTVNTSKEQTQAISQSNSSYTEKEVQVAPKTECVGNNHKMSSGNTGKWFETKAQADSYYNTEIEKWGKKWESGEIDKAEYLKKCPSGYEVWTCPQCQKWTLNFYYR